MSKVPKRILIEYLAYMYKGKYTESELKRLPARRLFGWYQSERNKRLNGYSLPIDPAKL